MQDFVTIPVEMTRKQRDWLKDLGEDKRTDLSDAFRGIVDRHIEAAEKDPMNPARHQMRKDFEHCLMCCDWREMYDLVQEFVVMLEQNEHKDAARELHFKLQELRKNRP